MSNYAGIAAAGKSIERLLNLRFSQDEPVSGSPTRAVLVRTTDLVGDQVEAVVRAPGLSLYVYRVDFNKTMRAAWSAVGAQDGRARLPLDIHFLVSPWAANAEDELRILGKAMEIFESTPILSGPLLDPSGDWAPNESIQLVLEEVSTEAVMRTFDSLPTDYRISVPYIARVVRLDARRAEPDLPVLTAVVGAVPGGAP